MGNISLQENIHNYLGKLFFLLSCNIKRFGLYCYFKFTFGKLRAVSDAINNLSKGSIRMIDVLPAGLQQVLYSIM